MSRFPFVMMALFIGLMAGTASAQSADDTRTVGRKGAKQLSLSFSTNTPVTADGASTTNVFGSLDIGRFLTEHFVVSFGVFGSGDIGGASSPVFYTNGGAVLYFTPQRVSSLYLGADVSTLITQIEGFDRQAEVAGKLGLQAAIKSNASFFVEGAYGGPVDALSTNGSLRTRVGLRVLF